jgi:hypothetical protein
MLRGWKISFKSIGNFSSEIDATINYQNSLANAVNMIVSYLIDMSIPHNILISEGGKVFYILPRNFNEIKSKNLDFNTNWIDLCGVITAKSQEFFDNAENKISEFYEYVANHLSLTDLSYNEINDNFFKKFQNLYKVNFKQNESI